MKLKYQKDYLKIKPKNPTILSRKNLKMQSKNKKSDNNKLTFKILGQTI